MLILAALYALLSFLLSEALRSVSLDEVRASRGAFAASLGMAALQWLAGLAFSSPPGAKMIGMAFGGAALGSLLGTFRRTGLWEDNFPPSEQMLAEINDAHRAYRDSLPPVPWAKRLFDFGLALAGLILSAPFWLLVTFLLWLENPGPLLFVKNSVGRGGRNFRQFKFRTMVRNAEVETGPVLTDEEDSRVLRVGHFLRKTALDELPQLINILRGEMSFVGPRPQRTVLVHAYLQTMPEYAERHRVLPGLSGLAQVVGSYYLTPRQKLRLDRLYARHAGFGFDLKLIALAFGVVFYLRWRKDWNGRLPRSWLHGCKDF